MKERVEFDAHKLVNKATKVAFRSKSAEKLLFNAERPTKVPVRLSFSAKRSSSR